MMAKRLDLEDLEEHSLAPYAQRSARTCGREHQEEEHDYRSVYQRDRDRIVHSTAFRRLQYKTQVFVNHEGDHYRTRLTHTLEVSQIARTMARALRLNEDLVEAVALAHDLGHTPFGHTGEDALRDLMTDFGGFEHNIHGLRVVEVLERRYVEFQGLNLAWETREAIAKHVSRYDHPETRKFDPDLWPPLEAQVVDAADSIAYSCHDLDDGLSSGLMDESDLGKVDLFRRARAEADAKAPGADQRRRRALIVRTLINWLATDLIETTATGVEENRVRSVDDVRRAPDRIVRVSPEMAERKREMEEYLFSRLYRHSYVCRMANKARMYVERIFNAYIADQRMLPPEYRERAERDGLERTVCDYIAGMTDRYAQDEYIKLFIPHERM